jgi:hypothetical protein
LVALRKKQGYFFYLGIKKDTLYFHVEKYRVSFFLIISINYGGVQPFEDKRLARALPAAKIA